MVAIDKMHIRNCILFISTSVKEKLEVEAVKMVDDAPSENIIFHSIAIASSLNV